MTQTLLSVILNTGRPGCVMPNMKTTHHFIYTIEALKRQTFKNFELIIADYIHEKRVFDWKLLGVMDFKIYHVPVDTLAKRMGYCAISGTKNAGIMFSEGEYLAFIDDCSSFAPDYLEKIYTIYKTQGTFPNPMRLKRNEFHPDRNLFGNNISDYFIGELKEMYDIDCRAPLFDIHKRDLFINCSDMYGFGTFSMEAALRLNGIDEAYDWSRQGEDIDGGRRLMAAGYKLSIHRNLFAVEQRHHNEAFQKYSPDEFVDIKFKRHMKCNMNYLYMKLDKRIGEDLVKANHRKFTEQEIGWMKPCYKMEIVGKANGITDGKAICRGSGLNQPCDWNLTGTPEHFASPDSEIFFRDIPVFDLATERQKKLATKERYRIV